MLGFSENNFFSPLNLVSDLGKAKSKGLSQGICVIQIGSKCLETIAWLIVNQKDNVHF